MGCASSLFNGTGEQTLINRLSPTAQQCEFLQTSWNELAEHLALQPSYKPLSMRRRR
jgi:hypothetical protein